MNVMSGHVILCEIHSNLCCCPLIILDLPQRAVGALRGTSLCESLLSFFFLLVVVTYIVFY